MRVLRATTLLFFPALITSTPVLAGVEELYRFSLRSQQSTVGVDLAAGATLAGTLVGNHDPKSNPTGTRTIPGVFGGPTDGNTPIPFSGSAGITGSDNTTPAGAFSLTLDVAGGTAAISGLQLDLLNGDNLDAVFGIELLYESFRTRQPTALFPGGIPIPIPLGQFSITALSLTQGAGAGPGVLQEVEPGLYTVTVIAPLELIAAIETPTEPIAVGPVTLPVPLVFEVELDGANASATLSFEQAFTQEIPLGLDLPADQPLDLPTVLPPGGTASLLLNAVLDALLIEVSLNATLDAAGTRFVFSRADWNRDTVVNSEDYFAFVKDFMTIGADFNEDGETTSQDYFDFLMLYFVER